MNIPFQKKPIRLDRKIILGSIFLISFFCNNNFGCTEFTLSSISNNTVIVGRTIDYHVKLNKIIRLIPSNTCFKGGEIGNFDTLSWSSKYSFWEVCVSPYNQKKLFPIDGINDQGLSVSLLGLSATQYPPTNNPNYQYILVDDFIPWCLSNFTSVAEVKSAIKKISITGKYTKDIKGFPLFHISVVDSNDNKLVIEFINGKMNLYNNELGILTNFALSTKEPKINNHSNSSSFLRFIKIYILKTMIRTFHNSPQGVMLAAYLLDSVKISKNNSLGENQLIHTQLEIIKDLKNKIIYFDPFINNKIYRVDFKTTPHTISLN